MKSRIEMSSDELSALVRAVLNYNGKEPESIVFVGSDGIPISLGGVQITCEEPGLKVRVMPEECRQYTPEEVVRFFSEMEPGNAAGK